MTLLQRRANKDFISSTLYEYVIGKPMIANLAQVWELRVADLENRRTGPACHVAAGTISNRQKDNLLINTIQSGLIALN